MGYAEPQFSLATLILSVSWAVTCVVLAWTWASRSTSRQKSPPSGKPTQISGRLDSLEVDMAELSSNLSALAKTVKRLSSRQAVADHRAKPSEENSSSQAPPIGASKQQLRDYYAKKFPGKVFPGNFPRAPTPELPLEHTPTDQEQTS